MRDRDDRTILRGLSRRRFIGLSAAALAGGFIPGRVRAKDTRLIECDVLVVGAGLAGLTAARSLIHQGISDVYVVEARGRVGGRTLNLSIGGEHVVEGGGEWIGPGQDRIAQLAEALGVRTFPAYYEGDTTFDLLGKISRGTQPKVNLGGYFDFLKLAWKIDRDAKKLPKGRPWDAVGAESLDSKTLGDWLTEQGAATSTWAIFRVITRSIMAGYPERISLLWFLYYVRGAGGLMPLITNDGGAQDLRFEGGSQLLSIKMAEALGSRLRLGEPVDRIEMDGDRLRVHAKNETYLARRVVIAMMPSDLLRIQFEPKLPPKKNAVAIGWARLPRLPIIKIAAIYQTPFWRVMGRNGSMQSDRAPLQLVFDNSPKDASLGVLSCFMSIAEAPEFADRRLREGRVLKQLSRYFGPQALINIGYVEKDWAIDPFSTGCITPLVPGILSESGPALRERTGLIHWAGTETAEAWCGFMDGAVRSGERAAREVYESLTDRLIHL